MTAMMRMGGASTKHSSCCWCCRCRSCLKISWRATKTRMQSQSQSQSRKSCVNETWEDARIWRRGMRPWLGPLIFYSYNSREALGKCGNIPSLLVKIYNNLDSDLEEKAILWVAMLDFVGFTWPWTLLRLRSIEDNQNQNSFTWVMPGYQPGYHLLSMMVWWNTISKVWQQIQWSLMILLVYLSLRLRKKKYQNNHRPSTRRIAVSKRHTSSIWDGWGDDQTEWTKLHNHSSCRLQRKATRTRNRNGFIDSDSAVTKDEQRYRSCVKSWFGSSRRECNPGAECV